MQRKPGGEGEGAAWEAWAMATSPNLDDRRLDGLTGATVELLQVLIRNRCVNDGTEASGEEVRNADVLQQVIEGPGVQVERYEAAPGRVSVVGRIEGSDPTAPSLCLMGHTDVVPVNASGLERGSVRRRHHRRPRWA